MIGSCIEYLLEILRENGIPAHADAAEAAKHQGAQWATIGFLDTKWFRDGSLVARAEDPAAGTRTYRRRLYKIALRTNIVIHSRRGQAADLGVTVAGKLDRRIWDAEQNAILVTVRGPQPEDDPSLLKDRSTVELLVDFEGGIYRDRTVPLLDLEPALEIEPQIATEEG